MGWQLRSRRMLVAVLVGGLVGSLAPVSPPAVAAPARDRGATPTQFAEGRLTPVEVVPVQAAAPVPGIDVVNGHKPVWPSAGEARVADLAAGAKARSVAGQPLRIGVPEHARASGEIVVGSVSRPLAERVVGLGAVWTLRGAAGSRLAVEVDYSGFAQAGGADWGGRLQLVALPECAVTTPEDPQCQVVTQLESANDREGQRLSAEVSLGSSAVTLAAVAAPSGPSGDFSATPLSAASSWAAGGSSGAFTWTYPLRTPPVAGGQQPSLAIEYSSQEANGRVTNTNNQGSWLGEGFDLQGGFIERRFAGCADESGTAGANNPSKTGDLCWATDPLRTNDTKWDNATLSLGGHSGELVRVGNTGQWRLKVDDGTRVEKIGAPGTPGESWKVTTSDGTQYWFGKGSTPGVLATNAVWRVPVAGNHAGEPGHQSTFANSFTTVPWRWNLDHVVSVNGDSMTYVYAVETNKYNKNLVTATSYDRGGYLVEVRYGERAGAETATPPARVGFAVAERCFSDASLPNCQSSTPNASNAYHWPDVPVDAICTGATCTTSQAAPTFFTRKKLAQIDTYVTVGSASTNVDRWMITSGFPDPGDASAPALWPQSIVHTGVSEGTLSVPAVTLTPTMKPNRVTGMSFGTPLTRPRLGAVTLESGGQIQVSYNGSDCTATNLPAPESNTRACFPAFYSENGSPPTLQWFNLYTVSAVLGQDTAQVVDPNNAVSAQGAVATRVSYSYTGGGAWRYDDSLLTPLKYRTWGAWRGFAKVTTITGDPAISDKPQQVSEVTYFRGMNGDRATPSGGVKTVTVTDSTGAAWPDDDHLYGAVRETRQLQGVGGPEITGKVEDPWQQATSSDGRTQVKLVGVAETRTRQATSTGTRTTRATIQARTPLGLPMRTQDTGDEAKSGDESCTRTSYAADNTNAWLVGLVAEETVMPTLCSVAYSEVAAISGVRHFYDNLALGAAPTLGRETSTDQLMADATTRSWVTTSQASHDAHGRVLTATDARGNTSTTAYTPALGSPVTQTTVTSPDPDGTGPITGLVATTHVDPRWGVPSKVIQPGGQTTQGTFDALGRLVRVWLPGQPPTANPSLKYTYTINAAGVNAIKTETLQTDGSTYGYGFTILDSLLRPRQSQAQSADGTGRVIRDTRYDSRGLATFASLYIGTGDPAPTLVQPTAMTSIPSSTTTVYDAAGRVTRTNLEEYGRERWATTTVHTGDKVVVTPPAGGTPTTTVLDVHGRTTELRQHLGTTTNAPASTTTYSYDPAGNLASITDPKNNTWASTYDLQGRKLTSNDPDAGTTTYSYDRAGNLIKTVDARGQGVLTTYDPLNRPTKTTSMSGTTLTTTTWDTVKPGLVSSTSRWVNTTQKITQQVNSYDNAGRATSSSMVVPAINGLIANQLAGTYTTTSSYHPDGSINTITLPATGPLPGESLATTYTNRNLPNRLTGTLPTGSYTYEYSTEYSQLGEPLRYSYGQGVHYSDQYISYDLSSRRPLILGSTNETGITEQTHLSWDPAGNITKLLTQPTNGQADTQCFAYDHQRQLTEAWTPASGDCATPRTQSSLGGPAPYWTSWATDTIGKTSQRVDRTPTTSTTTNFTHNPNGGARPHFITAATSSGSQPGTRTYTADAAGNTTTRPNNGHTQTLAYDAEGNLSTVSQAGAPIQTNLYDTRGTRILRKDTTSTTLYVDGTELKLTGTTLTATRTYTFGGRAIAQRTGTTDSTVTTLLIDHQGTTHQQVNSATGATSTQWHAPYGVIRTTTGTWTGERGFVGGTNDDTGLTHIGARDYDPFLNRFTTVDPIFVPNDPLSHHAYTYANNTPITASDPSGELILRMCIDECGGAADRAHMLNQLKKRTETKKSNKFSQGFKKGAGAAGKELLDVVTRPDKIIGNIKRIIQRPDQWGQVLVSVIKAGLHLDDLEGLVKAAASGDEEQLGYYTGRLVVGVGVDIGVMILGAGAVKGIQALKGSAVATSSIKTGAGLCSFEGPTLVLMADGTMKAIAQVRVGDKVLATDPETGEQVAKEVTELFVHEDTVADLVVDGEVIATTEDHPFWSVTEQRYERADDLDAGEEVLTADGRSLTTSGLLAHTARPAVAYNLEIEGIHTFHVGATAVLVHNTCQLTAAANGASNAANGARLSQQLAQESAESVFTSSGRLSSGAIAESRQIIPGAKLGNKELVERLTSDGSNIADWGKFTTRTHQSPSGDFQVHFYMNRSSGAIEYGYDYKSVFTGVPR